MDNYAELLSREQRNRNVAIVSFFAADYTEDTTVVFVEGDDDKPFYFDFIAEYATSDDVLFVRCEGKDNVFDAFSFFSSYSFKRRPRKILYLCDRDFEFDIKSRDIYRTDYYSIESYFIGSSFACYGLRKFSPEDIGVRKLQRFKIEIENDLSAMFKYMRAPMAVLSLLKSKGIKVKLDELSANDFFFVDETGTVNLRRGRSSALSRAIFGENTLKCSELRSRFRLLKKTDERSWIRGKHGLQFLKLAFLAACRRSGISEPAAKSTATLFGKGALTHGKAFLGEIRSLREYVEAR